MQLKTKEGWKIAKSQDQDITFVDKDAPTEKKILKSIDEIVSDDENTGSSIAKKTLFDKKADKFILPRADYDSGWASHSTSEFTHYLNTRDFSLRVYYANSSASWENAYIVSSAGLLAGPFLRHTSDNAITVSAGVSSGYHRVRIWK